LPYPVNLSHDILARATKFSASIPIGPDMIELALYQPDIPQNAGAAMRLCACLGVRLNIIEPCGFLWDDRKIRRSGMDYIDHLDLARHVSWQRFLEAKPAGSRLVLMTTRAAAPYADFAFHPSDILIAGRESAGVPDEVHDAADARIVIPLRPGLRSLNVVTSAAMVIGEALRQTGGFPRNGGGNGGVSP